MSQLTLTFLPEETPQDPLTEVFGEAISSYTQEDAVADGMLINAREGDFEEISQQHHPDGIPIYLTASLQHVMTTAIESYPWQSYKGIWHDVLSMARVYVRELRVGEPKSFPVIIGASDSAPHRVFVTLDGHSLTFMLREDL